MKDLYLHNPTYLELDDTYRSLPILKSVLVKSSNYEHVIADLEKIGFVAIEIRPAETDESHVTVSAFKGKHGPCHFTGKEVKYTGAALATLDDDHHIFLADRSKTVCDKTYRVLGLPPYQGLIERSKDGPTEDQFDSKIENGELEDFDTSQASLFDQLPKRQEQSDRKEVLFYPGPFRALVLSDGTMVYRGKWCSIPADLSRDLILKDRCIKSRDQRQGHVSYFQDEYRQVGSACLIGDFEPEAPQPPNNEPDFSKLTTIGAELKRRLLHTIDKRKKYFILIGNDASDQLGCCPSQEVSEANLLVRYGILDSLSEPLQGDSCPVTLYALKNELAITPDGFSSEIHEEIRSQVRNILSKSDHLIVMQVMKWILLIFILFSLVFATRKCQNLQRSNFDGSLYQQLNLPSESPYLVVLFHNQKRCYQCRQMEEHTNDLLLEAYSKELESKGLIFKSVVIDDPANANMVDMFGIFAPTLVLLQFEQKELIKSKVLLDATSLYRDEMAFKDLLKREIHQFLTDEDG